MGYSCHIESAAYPLARIHLARAGDVTGRGVPETVALVGEPLSGCGLAAVDDQRVDHQDVQNDHDDDAHDAAQVLPPSMPMPVRIRMTPG